MTRGLVYKHIHQKSSCLQKYNKDCFKILDQASTEWQLKLTEGVYIGWENPDINRQEKYVGKTLCL